MSAVDNAQMVRGTFAAFNERDFERGGLPFAQHAEIVNTATGERFFGPDGFRQYARGWLTAFPDSKVDVMQLSADEETASVEYVVRGTHTGPLVGPAGVIPPTGLQVELHFCSMFRVREGKIVGARTYFDSASMLRQLGLLPATPLHRSDRRAPLALEAVELEPVDPHRNEQVARRVYDEIFNRHHRGAIDALFSPDFVDHDPEPGQGPGIRGVKEAFERFLTAFPDTSVHVEELIAVRDRVVARIVLEGTNTGPFMGTAPTGKRVAVRAIDVLRISGGRVAERWGSFDALGMLQQLGAVPVPPPQVS